MPKVSIIVPNYNHARFLPQRIESVLNQSFQDFELIILDDASSDKSLEVIYAYADDPRIKVVQDRVNSGSPFVQWNKGVAMAKGDYVWIAESDDYAEPELLKTLACELDREPAAVLAFCQSLKVDDEGTVIGTMAGFTNEMFGPRWESRIVNDGSDECARFLLKRCVIPNASAVVFRKSAYPLADRQAETMRLSGDWLTWAKLLRGGKIIFTPEPLNYFRHHPSAIRSSISSWDGLRETSFVQNFIISQFSPSHADIRWVQDGLAADWRRLVRRCRTVNELKTALQVSRIIPRYKRIGIVTTTLVAVTEIVTSPLRGMTKNILRTLRRAVHGVFAG